MYFLGVNYCNQNPSSPLEILRKLNTREACVRCFTSASQCSLMAGCDLEVRVGRRRNARGGRNGRSPRKPADQFHRPARFPHAIRPGIEPGSPWWEARRLPDQPPRPRDLDCLPDVGEKRESGCLSSQSESTSEREAVLSPGCVKDPAEVLFPKEIPALHANKAERMRGNCIKCDNATDSCALNVAEQFRPCGWQCRAANQQAGGQPAVELSCTAGVERVTVGSGRNAYFRVVSLLELPSAVGIIKFGEDPDSCSVQNVSTLLFLFSLCQTCGWFRAVMLATGTLPVLMEGRAGIERQRKYLTTNVGSRLPPSRELWQLRQINSEARTAHAFTTLLGSPEVREALFCRPDKGRMNDASSNTARVFERVFLCQNHVAPTRRTRRPAANEIQDHNAVLTTQTQGGALCNSSAATTVKAIRAELGIIPVKETLRAHCMVKAQGRSVCPYDALDRSPIASRETRRMSHRTNLRNAPQLNSAYTVSHAGELTERAREPNSGAAAGQELEHPIVGPQLVRARTAARRAGSDCQVLMSFHGDILEPRWRMCGGGDKTANSTVEVVLHIFNWIEIGIDNRHVRVDVIAEDGFVTKSIKGAFHTDDGEATRRQSVIVYAPVLAWVQSPTVYSEAPFTEGFAELFCSTVTCRLAFTHHRSRRSPRHQWCVELRSFHDGQPQWYNSSTHDKTFTTEAREQQRPLRVGRIQQCDPPMFLVLFPGLSSRAALCAERHHVSATRASEISHAEPRKLDTARVYRHAQKMRSIIPRRPVFRFGIGGPLNPDPTCAAGEAVFCRAKRLFDERGKDFLVTSRRQRSNESGASCTGECRKRDLPWPVVRNHPSNRMEWFRESWKTLNQIDIGQVKLKYTKIIHWT
ncbi:hypothetical protein PR048_027344 [Dryococelus australis]|uniref:Uncharacterized protein n=1 Tax=Dryococelus australis TaxID=614101 RepID=A0ABQ9GF72_9NEOP|nr:hypothetical protein PR048_027344 [Dryococelus australis]